MTTIVRTQHITHGHQSRRELAAKARPSESDPDESRPVNTMDASPLVKLSSCVRIRARAESVSPGIIGVLSIIMRLMGMPALSCVVRTTRTPPLSTMLTLKLDPVATLPDDDRFD